MTEPTPAKKTAAKKQAAKKPAVKKATAKTPAKKAAPVKKAAKKAAAPATPIEALPEPSNTSGSNIVMINDVKDPSIRARLAKWFRR